MKNVFLINAHQPYPFAEGRLNRTLVEKARALLEAKGYAVKQTASAEGYDVEEELARHQWADFIILQTPVNWMGVTLNAPAEAFDDEREFLLQGRSVDDLFLPMHMNFRFFGLEAMETFACHDVMKNPQVESDLERFEAHINKLFQE